MRKTAFFAIGIIVITGILAGCSGVNKEREREDSIRNADSLAAVEATLEQIEEARIDSIREDSLEKSEIEKIIEDYQIAVDSYQTEVEKFIKSGYDMKLYNGLISASEKCGKLYTEILNKEAQLSEDQLQKFNSLYALFEKNFNKING